MEYFLLATTLSRMTLSFWFFMITFTAFCLLMVSLVFGHDNDADHDMDHDHDVDHDSDHSSGMSFLSVRVLLMFVSGFGAGGYFGARNDYGIISSSLWGVVFGLIMGAIGYLVLNYFYHHQVSSAVRVKDVIGKEGIVTTSIAPGSTGEVACWVGDRQEYFPAQTRSSQVLSIATKVVVQDSMGIVLIVEPMGN